MMAGSFREEGSGVPSGVAEAVERLRSGQEGSSTRAPGAEGGFSGEQSAEEAGVVLELEDIAIERWVLLSGDPTRSKRCGEHSAGRKHSELCVRYSSPSVCGVFVFSEEHGHFFKLLGFGPRVTS